MKKRMIALAMCTGLLTAMLTSCIQNDIGVKLNKNGTGTISATVGIEKDFYENFKELGTDPFEGMETTEYTYDSSTYVGHTETKEYESFEDIEQALLDMTYETDWIEEAREAQDKEAEENGWADSETDAEDSDADYTLITPPEKEVDPHIFKTVDIEKNSGIFYSVYSFNASLMPQADTEQYEANEMFHVTISLEMPEKITESKGGSVEDNKVTFEIADITEGAEIAAMCEVNNYAVVIGIVVLLVIAAGVILFLVKRNQ